MILINKDIIGNFHRTLLLQYHGQMSLLSLRPTSFFLNYRSYAHIHIKIEYIGHGYDIVELISYRWIITIHETVIIPWLSPFACF
jgi:hypothetical protein